MDPSLATAPQPRADPPDVGARSLVPLRRVAVRARDRIVILPAGELLRIDAEGNYVRLWTAERSWLHKDTLTAITAKLDPAEFLRVHRSHTVRMPAVRELLPLVHGEYRIRLADGSELTSGRAYRNAIRVAFGLA